MKTRKLKFILDFDKEEAWLNQMAAEGYLPVGATGPLYTFEPVEPATAVVRVDYRPPMKRPDFADYVNLFEDSGWRHLAGSHHGGPQYFASFSSDAKTDIFSDTASKAQRYRRSIAIYGLVSTPVLAVVIALWIQGTIGLRTLTSPKDWYLTPGLWQMQGPEFVGAFLFETIFVLFRIGGPLLLVGFCLYCLTAMAYQTRLHRKAIRDASTRPLPRRTQRRQPVGEQGVAGIGQDRLGVKLHALHGETSVHQPHDHSRGGTRRHRQTVGKMLLRHRQRVITRCGERHGQPLEQARALMMDRAGLTVSQLGGALHGRAVVLGYHLVSQTDAQNGHSAGEPVENRSGDHGGGRLPRPR